MTHGATDSVVEVDLLARFILGGVILLEGSYRLAMVGSGAARMFFLSPIWMVLRYTLIFATVVLCISICLGAK